MQHDVEPARGLRGDGGPVHPRERRERLQPGGDHLDVVGVDRREAAVVAGVERHEHLADLRPTALAQHDAVGPHA